MSFNDMVKKQIERNINKYVDRPIPEGSYYRPWEAGDDVAYYIYRDGCRDIGRVDSFEEAVEFMWREYDRWYDAHFNTDRHSPLYDRTEDFPLEEYHLVEVNFTLYAGAMSDPEEYEGEWYDFAWVEPNEPDGDWDIKVVEYGSQWKR